MIQISPTASILASPSSTRGGACLHVSPNPAPVARLSLVGRNSVEQSAAWELPNPSYLAELRKTGDLPFAICSPLPFVFEVAPNRSRLAVLVPFDAPNAISLDLEVELSGAEQFYVEALIVTEVCASNGLTFPFTQDGDGSTVTLSLDPAQGLTIAPSDRLQLRGNYPLSPATESERLQVAQWDLPDVGLVTAVTWRGQTFAPAENPNDPQAGDLLWDETRSRLQLFLLATPRLFPPPAPPEPYIHPPH